MARVVKAWLTAECALELPEAGIDADDAFDAFTTGAMMALAEAKLPGVLDGSWSLEDADSRDEVQT